jgi:hypothetical protein
MTLKPTLALLALAACQHDVTIGTPTITKRMSETRDLDLLFVIDNSSSTSDKQTLFAQNFPTFVTALDAFPGGRPNLHIGVVSTTIDIGSTDTASYGYACTSGADASDNGLLQATPRVTGCSRPNEDFIIDVDLGDGTRQTNYTGTLADTLSCIGQLGENGCGFESPMEAIKRALDGSHPENATFLRDDADLGIVILTDEDDCSADPSLFDLTGAQVGAGDLRCVVKGYSCDLPIDPAHPGSYRDCTPTHGGYLRDPSSYVDFLASIKDPSQTVVAVIGGDVTSNIAIGDVTIEGNDFIGVEPTCNATIDGNNAVARPGLRLDELVKLFGDHGNYESVCQSDYSPALTAIGQTLFTMMSPCLEGAISTADTDPTNPGLQPACTVTDDGVAIPACLMTSDTLPSADSPRPCWKIAPGASCATDTGLAITIERDTAPPTSGVLSVSCAKS